MNIDCRLDFIYHLVVFVFFGVPSKEFWEFFLL